MTTCYRYYVNYGDGRDDESATSAEAHAWGKGPSRWIMQPDPMGAELGDPGRMAEARLGLDDDGRPVVIRRLPLDVPFQSTPWGDADSVECIEEGIGIWSVDTPTHGGFFLGPHGSARFRERFPAFRTFADGERCQWFEEDQDACAVMLAFGEYLEEWPRRTVGPVAPRCLEALRYARFGAQMTASKKTGYAEGWRSLVETLEREGTIAAWERAAASLATTKEADEGPSLSGIVSRLRETAEEICTVADVCEERQELSALPVREAKVLEEAAHGLNSWASARGLLPE